MTRSRGAFIAVLSWALIASPIEISAQEDSLQNFKASANNLSHELVVCGAFFYITAIGAMNRNDAKGQEMGARQKEVGDYLVGVAARVGRIIEQKPEAFEARLEMALADLRGEMNDDFVNYSILQQKYLDGCTDLAANVDNRIASLRGMVQ
jgi:hypothetical protein